VTDHDSCGSCQRRLDQRRLVRRGESVFALGDEEARVLGHRVLQGTCSVLHERGDRRCSRRCRTASPFRVPLRDPLVSTDKTLREAAKVEEAVEEVSSGNHGLGGEVLVCGLRA
jgi:hypothetical protein